MTTPAEFEHEQIRAYAGEGRASANARGVKLGRKREFAPAASHMLPIPSWQRL